MALANKDSKILIVGGGGTIGSSTALHLARRGYTDIRLLDVFQNPSANSAGNDNNKIAGDDSAGIWGQLGTEAWKMWRTDPVFKDHSHNVGRLDLTSKEIREGRLRARYEGIVAEGRGDGVEWLDTKEAIVAKAPHLEKADLTGWKGLFVKNGGWVAAREALNSVGHELRRLGVKSAFGTAGTFDSLIFDEGDGRTVRGVRASDGTEWLGDLVIMAAGAYSPALIDLEDQCESKAWVYAHIQLTPEEAVELKGIPTMYNHELGFYMEPQPGTGVIKFCNEFGGLTNLTRIKPFGSSTEQLISVPRYHALNPTDTIPTEYVLEIQRLIEHCLPHLKGRELQNMAMCWCTDTKDMNWLMCQHPKFDRLVLATGDSGQTFKMFPVVGKQVADLIEGKLPEERKHLWQWRPQADDNGTGRGGERPKDLSEVEGWRHDPVVGEEPTSVLGAEAIARDGGLSALSPGVAGLRV
ncbi:sarcosine oxidase [Kwoniella heveanensis BCC8398]|uniref:Sarcosine oxidase n=1 Tax=Kwoniella heveanensis BCC8398 TaxID=1296120 RepID=A0A1B9GS60_9TREE|nr:sarcosine oxidase [Kwoniella heveanensis BCC8398]